MAVTRGRRRAQVPKGRQQTGRTASIQESSKRQSRKSEGFKGYCGELRNGLPLPRVCEHECNVRSRVYDIPQLKGDLRASKASGRGEARCSHEFHTCVRRP